MASTNIDDWIIDNSDAIGKRALEIGSKKHKDGADLKLDNLLRENSPHTKLIGCDFEKGDGVDVVIDITAPISEIRSSLGVEAFNTVFCISVLEHIPDIFRAAENITELLRPRGSLFISVPFIHRYHGYPADYWRFTPQSLLYLFPDIDFKHFKCSSITTFEKGDKMKIDDKKSFKQMNRFLIRPNSLEDVEKRKDAKKRGEYIPYSMVPSYINLMGKKKEGQNKQRHPNILRKKVNKLLRTFKIPYQWKI
tara:strand:- start:4442 stop:5194 length:753 start_codon:yes stop_codon:yes gene_type:complete